MPKTDSVPKFSGFPRQATKFLKDLTANNERDWFQPRKADYEQHVRDPMLLLVTAVNDRLRKVAIDYVVPDPKKALYRIYRDTRFSKDKTPYKTNVSAYFQRKGYAKNMGPGFYMQLDYTGRVGIAGGIYMVGPDEMKAIREAIARSPKAFAKLAASKKLQSLMGEIKGEALKRPAKGFEQVESPYVRMKQWYYWTELEPKFAASRELPKLIEQRIEAMLPVCEWIHDTLQAAVAQDADNRPRRPEPMF
jgi:uncharacterized protein (TIGR02453 family)